MKNQQHTKFSLFHYKEIAQQTIAMAIIFAFTLTICAVPSTAKTKSTKKRSNSSKRLVKPSAQTEKDLTDPNLDTLTVANKMSVISKKDLLETMRFRQFLTVHSTNSMLSPSKELKALQIFLAVQLSTATD